MSFEIEAIEQNNFAVEFGKRVTISFPRSGDWEIKLPDILHRDWKLLDYLEKNNCTAIGAPDSKWLRQCEREDLNWEEFNRRFQTGLTTVTTTNTAGPTNPCVVDSSVLICSPEVIEHILQSLLPDRRAFEHASATCSTWRSISKSVLKRECENIAWTKLNQCPLVGDVCSSHRFCASRFFDCSCSCGLPPMIAVKKESRYE